MQIKDHVFIVTGASSGIGLSTAIALSDRGAKVALLARSITATNFGKNRMVNSAGGGPSANYAEGDKPELVAGLILKAIEEGQAQYFANDRLRLLAGVSP